MDTVFSEPTMAPGSDQYLKTFRYFSKLLACHLAEMGAPVQAELSDFAIGKTHFNPVGLAVRRDNTFARTAEEFPDLQYAAHGGVVVFGNKHIFWPTTFYSTLTVGPIQYCFQASLNLLGQLRLWLEFPDFFRWCRDMVRTGAEDPVSDEELEDLGLQR